MTRMNESKELLLSKDADKLIKLEGGRGNTDNYH